MSCESEHSEITLMRVVKLNSEHLWCYLVDDQ